MRRRRSTAGRRPSRLRPARPARRFGDRRRGNTTCRRFASRAASCRWLRPSGSSTSMNTRGSLDSESAQGATIPTVAVRFAADAQVATHVQKNALYAFVARRGPASQARPTMYPLAIPFKLSGQSESRSAVRAAGSSFQAGGVMRALTWASSSGIGPPACPGAAPPEPRQRLGPRVERPSGPLRSRNRTLAGLRIARRRCRSMPGRRSCQRESSLAGSYPLKMAANRSISRRTRSSAASAAFRLSARTRSSSDVPMTFS